MSDGDDGGVCNINVCILYALHTHTHTHIQVRPRNVETPTPITTTTSGETSRTQCAVMKMYKSGSNKPRHTFVYYIPMYSQPNTTSYTCACMMV